MCYFRESSQNTLWTLCVLLWLKFALLPHSNAVSQMSNLCFHCPITIYHHPFTIYHCPITIYHCPFWAVIAPCLGIDFSISCTVHPCRGCVGRWLSGDWRPLHFPLFSSQNMKYLFSSDIMYTGKSHYQCYSFHLRHHGIYHNSYTCVIMLTASHIKDSWSSLWGKWLQRWKPQSEWPSWK